MTEPEDLEEDLFADLYDAEDSTAAPAVPTPAVRAPAIKESESKVEHNDYGVEPETGYVPPPFEGSHEGRSNGNINNDDYSSGRHASRDDEDRHMSHDSYGANIKEDGKMFIGGLNWETTDQSLRDYFEQFGEVSECTVMRDGATGRSRGFGFLTFKDPKTVNTVMVKEHFLDGKIIDPKRAIPRDEQEKTSKIFVGGVSQDASEDDFKDFFTQFGRVVDATLMMDKDTGRPRGFGFVTFDSEAAVERCLDFYPLEILGKPIEVKKAQPRGKMGEEEESSRTRGGRGRFNHNDRYNNDNSNSNQSNQGGQNMSGSMMSGGSGMTPQMMAQYWQRMQQYFAMMQQQMAANTMGGQMPGMMGGMPGMNPQLMQQMQQMQQMQMKQMQGQQQGSMSPAPQSPGSQNSMQGMGNMQNMNPQQQQMMMQQMQMMGGMNGMNNGMQNMPQGPRGGFSALEQQAFEQRKYEEQHARRSGGSGSFQNQQVPGGPTSWEGMYDGEPQPNQGRAGAGVVRNLTPNNNGPLKAPKGPGAPSPQPGSAPANAPTGPKNAGKPGSNFRGGRGGGRFHPYGR